MTLTLYNNLSDSRTVSKRIFLLGNKQCNTKEPSSIYEPRVVVHKSALSSWASANYARISEYGRYYYIKDIVTTTAGMLEITMHTDVLMSFPVRSLFAYVERQENAKNLYMPDEYVPVRAGRQVNQYKVGQLEDSPCFIVTTNGGVLT